MFCLLFLACTDPRYTLRTAKIALVAGPGQSQWIAQARETVRYWNQSELAGKPFRIELIIYDAAEGPAVARRLLIDSEVRGVVIGEANPLKLNLEATRLVVRSVWEGQPAGPVTRVLLEEVARAP